MAAGHDHSHGNEGHGHRHGHSHGHGHHHGHHHHGPVSHGRAFAIAVALNGLFVMAEVAASCQRSSVGSGSLGMVLARPSEAGLLTGVTLSKDSQFREYGV